MYMALSVFTHMHKHTKNREERIIHAQAPPCPECNHSQHLLSCQRNHWYVSSHCRLFYICWNFTYMKAWMTYFGWESGGQSASFTQNNYLRYIYVVASISSSYCPTVLRFTNCSAIHLLTDTCIVFHFGYHKYSCYEYLSMILYKDTGF